MSAQPQIVSKKSSPSKREQNIMAATRTLGSDELGEDGQIISEMNDSKVDMGDISQGNLMNIQNQLE